MKMKSEAIIQREAKVRLWSLQIEGHSKVTCAIGQGRVRRRKFHTNNRPLPPPPPMTPMSRTPRALK
jgi:hypothetical protein